MSKATEKKLVRSDRRRAKQRRVNLVGFIPARGGSKAIPHKNLAVVAGYPLVAHSILALHVTGVEDIYVSTDDNEIADLSMLYGAKPLRRPDNISQDCSPAEDAIGHFFGEVRCDAMAMVQCTSPMLSPVHIRLAINKFIARGYDSVFTVVRTNDTLIWDKELHPINYDPRKRGMRQRRKRWIYIETGGLYCVRRTMFAREHCRIGGKVGVQIVPEHQAFQIDTPRNLVVVSKLMEQR